MVESTKRRSSSVKMRKAPHEGAFVFYGALVYSHRRRVCFLGDSDRLSHKRLNLRAFLRGIDFAAAAMRMNLPESPPCQKSRTSLQKRPSRLNHH
jgi:hypothetical protein